MKTFKEFLAESQMNEVKISNTHSLKYFKLIQKALGSRTMKTDLVEDVLEVKYDTVSLFFKEGYLVGFRDEDGETYEVSRSLRSVKDLKSVKDIQKHLGAKKSPERMQKPVQQVYNYQPKSNKELKGLVVRLIEERGNNADLNDIDTSKITDMSWMFNYSVFNGDISKWNTSKVEYMNHMFSHSKFNGDISKWDVSKVEDMSWMIHDSQFNGDISKWDVSKVEDMNHMFHRSQFNGDIGKWNVSKVEDMNGMFNDSKFNGDISKWDVSKVEDMGDMFSDSPLEGKEPDWYRD